MNHPMTYDEMVDFRIREITKRSIEETMKTVNVRAKACMEKLSTCSVVGESTGEMKQVLASLYTLVDILEGTLFFDAVEPEVKEAMNKVERELDLMVDQAHASALELMFTIESDLDEEGYAFDDEEEEEGPFYDEDDDDAEDWD